MDPDPVREGQAASIVNVDRVSEIRSTPHGDSVVLLHDGTKLRMSRSRRERLGELMRSLH